MLVNSQVVDHGLMTDMLLDRIALQAVGCFLPNGFRETARKLSQILTVQYRKEQGRHGSRRKRRDTTEREILKKAREILESTKVLEKEWTGGRMKKHSTAKKKILGGRMPIEIINEANRLKGWKTYDLQRALRFYLKVLKAGEWSCNPLR